MSRPGKFTIPTECWKHLKWAKRVFWKRERKAAKYWSRRETRDPKEGLSDV